MAKAFDVSRISKSNDDKSNGKFDKKVNFILIDKASQRRKFDNKLQDETPGFDVRRIRVDIQDLVLGKIDDLKNRVSISVWYSSISDLKLN